jgi:hypothetical protein
MAVRDAMGGRTLISRKAARHVSFWERVYDDEQWKQERQQIYGPDGTA